MDWGEFFKQTGMLAVAVLAALAAVLAWIERLMKVRELQRRLEQLEHERKQRISRIHLPTDEEVRIYTARLFPSVEVIGRSMGRIASEMRRWTAMPLKYAADMADTSEIGQLPVGLVRNDVAAIVTALEHLEVIAETGLAANDQLHKIMEHMRKVLSEIGPEGVAMLDALVGAPVASSFLAEAERARPPLDLDRHLQNLRDLE